MHERFMPHMAHAGPHALALARHPGTDNICPGPAFAQNKPLIKQLVLVLAHGLSPSLFNEKRHLLPNLQKLGKPVVVTGLNAHTKAGEKAGKSWLSPHMRSMYAATAYPYHA